MYIHNIYIICMYTNKYLHSKIEMYIINKYRYKVLNNRWKRCLETRISAHFIVLVLDPTIMVIWIIYQIISLRNFDRNSNSFLSNVERSYIVDDAINFGGKKRETNQIRCFYLVRQQRSVGVVPAGFNLCLKSELYYCISFFCKFVF